MTLLRLELPLKLPSAGTLREHWRVRAARVKAQRAWVTVAMTQRSKGATASLNFVVASLMGGESMVCTLTRISPRKLDSDNLQFAFKAVRDQVAEELGIDDGSDAVLWQYAQESGKQSIWKQSIRIEIARRELAAVAR